jgi:hypothetical protein
MSTTKKYFQDHFVLLLVSINGFLALSAIIFILIHLLSTSHSNGYIVQYRPSLGVNSYQTGGILQLFSFTVFALLVVVTNIALSYRVYKIQRQLAIGILGLGILLLVLTIIISNALLLLR